MIRRRRVRHSSFRSSTGAACRRDSVLADPRRWQRRKSTEACPRSPRPRTPRSRLRSVQLVATAAWCHLAFARARARRRLAEDCPALRSSPRSERAASARRRLVAMSGSQCSSVAGFYRHRREGRWPMGRRLGENRRGRSGWSLPNRRATSGRADLSASRPPPNNTQPLRMPPQAVVPERSFCESVVRSWLTSVATAFWQAGRRRVFALFSNRSCGGLTRIVTNTSPPGGGKWSRARITPRRM